MTDTPIAPTEGGLLAVTQEDRNAAARAYDQNGLFLESERASKGLLDDGYYCQAFARHRLATRTPSPCSLGEDVVERVARALAGKHGIRSWDDLCPRGFFCTPRFIGKDYWFEQAETALSALRPVQEEGVGEDGWRPIESAPKDGTVVDLWLLARHREHGLRVTDVFWDNGRSWASGIGRVALPDAWVHYSHRGELRLDGRVPTHWRLPPKPPLASHSDASPPVQEGEGQ